MASHRYGDHVRHAVSEEIGEGGGGWVRVAVCGRGWLRSGLMLAVFVGLSFPTAAGAVWSWTTPRVVDRQPPFGRSTTLTAVSCPSVSLCVAIDSGDPVSGGGPAHVVTSSAPTGGWKAWHPTPIDA